MKPKIWEKCLHCTATDCCKKSIARNLFLTDAERERESLPGINKTFPCSFLDKNNFCTVHSKRPIDCRLFPFDINKSKGKFFWVIYKNFDCPIVKKGKLKDLEEALKDIEKNIMPKFKNYLEDYSHFRAEELTMNFGPVIILREINLS